MGASKLWGLAAVFAGAVGVAVGALRADELAVPPEQSASQLAPLPQVKAQPPEGQLLPSGAPPNLPERGGIRA